MIDYCVCYLEVLNKPFEILPRVPLATVNAIDNVHNDVHQNQGDDKADDKIIEGGESCEDVVDGHN